MPNVFGLSKSYFTWLLIVEDMIQEVDTNGDGRIDYDGNTKVLKLFYFF